MLRLSLRSFCPVQSFLRCLVLEIAGVKHPNTLPLPALCAVCVRAGLIVRASAATHTVLGSSMDKRLYLSPSALTHTHARAHEEEQRRYLRAAEHAESNALRALSD